MALPTCPDCDSDDVDLVEKLPDSRRHLICCSCDRDWLYGDAVRQPTPLSNYDAARKRFPSPADVPVANAERAEQLKQHFLSATPDVDPRVPPFWQKYRRAFSLEHMDSTPDQDFKDFANSPVGAYAGMMTVFNDAWNEMGPELASRRVRDSLRYLLHGPDHVPIEDRLTDLIRGDNGMGMTGFRESLLTKVLCIAHPDRFLPITMYTGSAGTSTGGSVSSMADYIKKIVDSAPPLTPEQRDRLAVLLRLDIQPQPDEVRRPATTVDDIVNEL